MPGKDIIFKALESFPKIELEDIRHYFGAELPSRVRKSELVERLGAYIVERPEVWLSIPSSSAGLFLSARNGLTG